MAAVVSTAAIRSARSRSWWGGEQPVGDVVVLAVSDQADGDGDGSTLVEAGLTGRGVAIRGMRLFALINRGMLP